MGGKGRGAAKNLMNKDRLRVMLEVNRVWKPPDENAANGIKTNRIMQWALGNQRVSGLETLYSTR